MLVLVGVIIAALIIWDRAKFGVFLTALLTVVPALVGLLFLFGHPTPKRAAYAVSVGIPLLLSLTWIMEIAWRSAIANALIKPGKVPVFPDLPDVMFPLTT